MDTEKQLEILLDVREKLTGGMASEKDLKDVFDVVLGIIEKLSAQLSEKIAENKNETETIYRGVYSDLQSVRAEIKDKVSKISKNTAVDIDRVRKQLEQKVNDLIDQIPTLPDLTPIEKKLTEIESKIPEKYNDEEVVKKITDLEEEIEQIKQTPKEVVREIVRGGGNVEVFSNNTKIGSSQRLKFTGATVTNDADGAIKVAISSVAGGSAHTIQDEGTPLTQRANLNFVGAAVAVTDDAPNDATKVTISATGIVRNVSVITASTTAGDTALNDYVYIAKAGIKVTLPTAVNNSNLYTVKNFTTSSVLVDTTSAQTIDGSASALLPVENQSLDFISDNSNWMVV